MAENRNPDTKESSFESKLEQQIAEIQAHNTLKIGTVHDLKENQKIWLVIGICLHNIITPILRKYVESFMTSLYNSLVKSHKINTQAYLRQIQNYPHQGNNFYRLKYICINNNKAHGCKRHLYDYKVQNAVDLSKLFLLEHMTKYNGFDDTCDASVLLGIINNVDGFLPAVKAISANIRSDIRNPWAHCNFRQWSATKFSLSFNLMENFIKNLKLCSSDEKTTLDKLIMWKTNGLSFLSGTTLGLEHIKDIHKEICVLAQHAQVKTMKTTFEEKTSSLEKRISSEMEQMKLEFSNKVQAFSLAVRAQLLQNDDKRVSLLMEQKECIPRNIRAQHVQYLEEWKEDDESFVNTRAARYTLSSLQSNNCLLVTGSSGTGKSFIVHHIALHLLDKEGYEIIPFVTGPADIIHYYDPKRKQVFVVDDICGKESINIQIIELWKSYYSNLIKIFLPIHKNSPGKDVFQGTTLLMSCRLLISKDKLFRNIQLFTRNECNLLSSDMCLLPQERSLMVQQYLPKDMICYVENKLDNFDFFPLLCCLSKGKTSEELVKLFSTPIDIITHDVNNIYMYNKLQFCALVLCVLFQEGFNITWVTSKSMSAENRFKIYEIVKELGIDLNIDSSRKSLVEGFTTLEDTFLKKRGTSYRIIHDKVHTFISVYCSEHLTSCFLRYAPSSFVRDHFRFKCCQIEHTDNYVALETEMEEAYFNRLLDDLKDGDVWSMFYNKLLPFTSFRNKLLHFFKQNEETMVLLKKSNSQVFQLAKIDQAVYNYYSDFTNPLIEAANAGFQDLFEFFIDLEWNQIHTHLRISTVYAACRNGNVEIVKLLLNGNTNIACNTVAAIFPTAAQTLLQVACLQGHTAVVQIILDSITDISQFIKMDKQFILHNACEDRYTDLEKVFYISKGMDFTQLCVHGRSPLYMACYKGNFNITSMLLNVGADTSLLCDSSLFAKACKDGYVNILKILIANDRSKINLNGDTLLVEACKRGHTEIVEVLLDNDTQIFKSYDFNVRLPLYLACQKGHTDIVRFLLKYKLSFSCVQFHSEGLIPLEISKEIEYNDMVKMLSEFNTHAKIYGYLYLFIAGCIEEEKEYKSLSSIKMGFYSKYAKLLLPMTCYFGHIETVRVLVENGFGINQCTSDGVSSLYAACMKGHTNIVLFLLEVNADASRCDKSGKSPLCIACEKGHTDTVKLLLEHKAEISPCGRSMKSPFFVACEKGYGDIVRILIESNVDVFECYRYGRSPLYVACKNGNTEIVNILLSNDVATFKHDKYGKSPMCVACEEGHLHIVNLLLKYSIDFSHCVYRECSLIITALGRGHIEIANMLLQNNIDRCQCDGFERTPSGIVCETENAEITNLLTKLREEYSTQCAGDTNTVEILFYPRFFSEYKILHLYIPRLRLYTEIFNHFLKSEQQNENKPNNQE